MTIATIEEAAHERFSGADTALQVVEAVAEPQSQFGATTRAVGGATRHSE